ncbi:MAG: helical backbone metal receptor [Rhodoferax sp.]|nr:helical backbone metal receptor [Rhodoferax sp.]
MAHGRLVTLILTGWLLAAGAVQAVQVTDDRGLTVTFARTPQRIVSLLPSLTESVCALGQCRRLVGVDRYSNYPESVQALPQVGGGLDPNLEAVIALKPDVVLMATSAPVGERLQSLGIKVLALEPKTHADVRRVLEVIGRLLEVNDAARVWRGIEAGVLTAVRSLPPGADKTRVYFEVNSAPYAASESSFIGETLSRLGVKNIVPGNLGPFPKLNPEFVVRANPDVIMVGDRSYAGLQGRPGWSGIRAIREGQVCVFTAAQADVVVRPGPRMAEGAQIMARCLLGSGS